METLSSPFRPRQRLEDEVLTNEAFGVSFFKFLSSEEVPGTMIKAPPAHWGSSPCGECVPERHKGFPRSRYPFHGSN